MTRKSSSTISKKAVGSKKPASPPALRDRCITLDDIDEAETALWLAAQLIRVRAFAQKHDADDEMLEAIDYLIDETKEVWMDWPLRRTFSRDRLSSASPSKERSAFCEPTRKKSPWSNGWPTTSLTSCGTAKRFDNIFSMH
jgi:hypothetical protein